MKGAGKKREKRGPLENKLDAKFENTNLSSGNLVPQYSIAALDFFFQVKIYSLHCECHAS